MNGAHGEVTLTIHGLSMDNGNVRAEVFVEKLRALLSAFRSADKFLNNKKTHDYLIVGLQAASAHATVRERISIRKIVPQSSLHYVGEAAGAIYNGDRNINRFPQQIIKNLSPLVKNVGKTFSHGEVGFQENNIIRIDEFLGGQMEKAVRRINHEEISSEKYFEGIALETFDGIVKEIDARGTLVRGKLVLTVGAKEIDCIFRKEDINVLRNSFDLRARVESVAHYTGDSPLPVRLDVKRLTVLKPTESLNRWKGALRRRRTQNEVA